MPARSAVYSATQALLDEPWPPHESMIQLRIFFHNEITFSLKDGVRSWVVIIKCFIKSGHLPGSWRRTSYTVSIPLSPIGRYHLPYNFEALRLMSSHLGPLSFGMPVDYPIASMPFTINVDRHDVVDAPKRKPR